MRWPSVSKILDSTTDKSGIEAWRNRIGHAEADRIIKESKDIGISMHSIIEDRFALPTFDMLNYKDQPGYEMYLQLGGYLSEMEPFALELKMWSEILGVNGRTDCVGLFREHPSVIDFKNSRTPKRAEWIENYFIQATLYALMLHDLLGIAIKQIVLLVAVRSEPFPQVFVRRTSQYAHLALDRVAQFYKNAGCTPATYHLTCGDYSPR